MGDAAYLRFLRDAPCAVQPCTARSEAHHSTVAPTFAPGDRAPKQLAGKRGKGQKSADYYAFSLCLKHHAQFHRGTGHFEGWDGAELEAWQNEQSREHRERYESAQADVDLFGKKTKTPRPRFDAKEAAQKFCRERELGEQVAFDLAREIPLWIKEARS